MLCCVVGYKESFEAKNLGKRQLYVKAVICTGEAERAGRALLSQDPRCKSLFESSEWSSNPKANGAYILFIHTPD